MMLLDPLGMAIVEILAATHPAPLHIAAVEHRLARDHTHLFTTRTGEPAGGNLDALELEMGALIADHLAALTSAGQLVTQPSPTHEAFWYLGLPGCRDVEEHLWDQAAAATVHLGTGTWPELLAAATDRAHAALTGILQTPGSGALAQLGQH